jgi:hypothetical protein
MTSKELVLNFVNQYRKPFDAKVEAHVEQHRLAHLIKPIENIGYLIKQQLLEVQDISLQHGIGFFLGDTSVVDIAANTDSQFACRTAVWLQPQTFMSY